MKSIKDQDEAQEMIEVCLQEKCKRTKELMRALINRMLENPNEPGSKEITIYFCPKQTVKDNTLYDTSLLVSALLFLFLRYKRIKLKLISTTESPPKVKKPNIIIRANVPPQEYFKFSKHFLEKAQEMLRSSMEELDEAALHFEEISIDQEGGSANGQGQRLDLLRWREKAYQFVYHFYYGLREVFSSHKVFLVKNSLNFIFQRDLLSDLDEREEQSLPQQSWIKKILEMQENFFINTLTLKVRHDKTLSLFCPSQTQQEEEERNEEDEKHKIMGFFSGFSGSPCQYLSYIYLYVAVPSSLTSLKVVLPRVPNLTHLQVIKNSQEMSIDTMDEVLSVLAAHNQLIERFWFNRINVRHISAKVLKEVYLQCPYLTELELHLPLVYIQEGNEEQRECGLLLLAMKLRKITLEHNIQMAKLLIAKEYNTNEVIEIIDCISPFAG